ncbi:hypothetical protein B566_EDAN017882 [Ephemera danica]|nr:hypothetical protein B566_EDAN017882 [Ephemera danica]
MRGVFLTFAVVALLVALVGSSPLPRERLRGRREHVVRRGNSRPVSDKPNTWAYEDYALPTDLRPLEYTVHLIPYFEDPAQFAFTFDGTVKALFHVDVATDVIRIHAGFDMNVNKISVTVRKDGLIDDLRDFLTINLLSTLEVNTNYTVEMSFWGHLNDDAEGFYRSSYTDSNGVQQWIGVTHMETVSARRAFPCWDEPAWKALFIMHIAHAPDRHVISNMPVFRDIELVPNMPLWRYTEFEPTPLMSTYLICWLVSDFEYIQSVQDPRVKTWARPGQAANTHYGNDVAPRLINYMEYFTGYPYMLPKMDQAAVPGFASGAMENWGLLTYRYVTYEKFVLYNRENTEAITAHEVSHQWFGDLVSPQWWDNLWLNEGFARYFEYHGLLDIEPTWQYGERYVYEQMHYVLVVDSLNETHPMFVQGVDSPLATYDMFDSIAYEKGSCIVRFMINLLGENNFMAGANNYMVNKQYSNAVMDDLWAAMEPHVPPGQLPPGVTFKQVMDTWTLQAGYPVIRVVRDYATNRAFIEPTWQYGERYVYEQMHYVLVVDSLNETHPMFVQGVDSPLATYDMFDSIAYEKGSCIVRFMINLLGENNFMAGANNYMVNKQYSNAVMDDLWAAMEPHVPPGQLPPGVTFKQVMDTWTLQAGYPVIRVIRDYATNRAFRRFVTDSDNPYFEVYMTPITLTTELAPNFDDLRVWGWQGGSELVISSIPASSTQWLIVNLKQTGVKVLHERML